MKFLNNKETKRLIETLENQYNVKLSLDDYYIYTSENKFYLISKDIAKINLEELNIKSIGLYLGKMEKGNFVISPEAAHLLDLPVSQI